MNDIDEAPNSLEHSVQDAGVNPSGDRRVISRRMLYVELNEAGMMRRVQYAPYLDYRPLTERDPHLDAILDYPECAWIDGDMESKARGYAVENVVPEHLKDVRDTRLALIAKTEAAVQDRLTKEIAYWDRRLGFEPVDREFEKLGCDIESRVPGTGQLRFI